MKIKNLNKIYWGKIKINENDVFFVHPFNITKY
jgi:hypothetical protein